MTECQQNPPVHERSDVFIGKYILVGLTCIDAEGDFVGQDQRHGVIVSVESSSIGIALKGDYEGEMFTIPLDLRTIMDAEPGEYLLQTTNEVVVDPDLISAWTVKTAA